MYKISYIGDGVTNEFLFAFPFFQAADIRAAINDKVLGTDEYSVYPDEDFKGGNVVFLMPPEKDARIDIFRKISLSRVVDYQPTAKIDPEHLNSDFNFLLNALLDFSGVDLDLAEWTNTFDNTKAFLDYTVALIQDKLSGGGVLGLYNNLLSVLDNALPQLINDYGSITEPAPNENCDDYGLL